MSHPRTMFMDCPRCRGKCIRLYTAGAERKGIPVLIRKFLCERCGRAQTTVERRGEPTLVHQTPAPKGWPKPDRKWCDLGLSSTAFA